MYLMLIELLAANIRDQIRMHVVTTLFICWNGKELI